MKYVARWKKLRKRVLVPMVTLIVLPIIYLAIAYTDLGPVARLRDLYIETAMSTMTHQYLAKIFPPDVVEAAMEGVEEQFELNKIAETLPLDRSAVKARADRSVKMAGKDMDPYAPLQELFPELDMDTVKEHVAPEQVRTLSVEGGDTGIKTIHGDRVYALNVPEEILIVNIESPTYNGMLAISGRPEACVVGLNRDRNKGQTVTEICGNYDAVLGINGSGFVDPNGRGAGNQAVGLVMSQGVLSGDRKFDRYQIGGMDVNDNFVVGYGLDTNTLRDAVQFYPLLVSGGEKVATGSYGMGIQPRSCIGQNSRGDMMFLVIDGRQVGHSIGITVPECADILLKYDCYVAMNLDGGSSASMTYDGKMITRTSSPKSDGRYLPNAWIVLRKNAEADN